MDSSVDATAWDASDTEPPELGKGRLLRLRGTIAPEMQIQRRNFVVGVFGLTLWTGCRLRSEGVQRTVQQLAPEFTLPDQGGAAVSLAQLRDASPAIIVFYRGFW
ncbi:MAG: redoxin domain-containing protein [Nannocystaceae bacterium]|nr:redoxin domain-containing protein [Nannocystaceae bacterium]